MTWAPDPERTERFRREVPLERARLALEDPEGERDSVAPLSSIQARQMLLEADLPGQRPKLSDLVVNIKDYRAAVPTEIPWRCKPIVYSGGVTLIAGPPKAGKSTLSAQLQACAETGLDFAGSWPVAIGPCLLVTEEGGVAVAYKTNGLERLDVFDRRSAIMASLSFGQVLEVVAEWSAQHPDGIAFIDTLAIWAGIENENDASQATHAIAQVTALAQQADLAVVLIHHARKSGGEHGEAIRGSGAILGTVDIAVEMSRTGPLSDDRYLDVQGRVVMPERHLLTFDRLTMTYRLEDRMDSRLEQIETDLAGVPDDGPGLSRAELSTLWNKDSRKRSEELVNLGRMKKRFVNVGKTNAYRYWSIPAAWTPALVSDE
jgi:hypothetical protein